MLQRFRNFDAHTHFTNGDAEFVPQWFFGFLGDRYIPDGFAFDAAGNVLCAGFRSSPIHVFPPQGGEKIATVDFDDDRVTNVCFGGPNGSTVFVTESGSGRVVSFEWEHPGMVLFPDR